MSFQSNWTIVGTHPFAEELQAAARYVPIDTPVTIVTVGDVAPPDAWVVGPASLSSRGERYAPYYAAFEAIETLKQGFDSGEVGALYGLFGSFRVSRETSPADVPLNALLPLLGIALDLIAEPVVRAWATNASLLAENDAWFVHLRTAAETLLTLEAIACCDPVQGSELLVEVTGHDRVLRAEPMRQAVVVERLGTAPAHQPWWEDLGERYLRLIAARHAHPADRAGSRLRAVYGAVMRSAKEGEPVAIG